MTKGLPASGKSTWSITQVLNHAPGSIVRINRGMLRHMLHGGKRRNLTDTQVLAARDALAVTYLTTGVDVIVDDTNLNPIHEKRLRDLADHTGARFVVRDFTDVPLTECLLRDANRSRGVGSEVIVSTWQKWLAPKHTTCFDPRASNARQTN